MNLKIIIPICVIIIGLGFSVGLLIDEYLEQKHFEYPKPCGGCGFNTAAEILPEILKYCGGMKAHVADRESLVWDYIEFTNSTHHIDIDLCEWHTIDMKKHPMNPDYRQNVSGKGLDTGIYLNNTFIPDVDVNYYDYRLDDNFETDYTDDFSIKSTEYSKKYCTVEIIEFLTQYSNMFDNEEFYYKILIGIPDNISEDAFNKCEHELKAILYPQFTGEFNKEQSMDEDELGAQILRLKVDNQQLEMIDNASANAIISNNNNKIDKLFAQMDKLVPDLPLADLSDEYLEKTDIIMDKLVESGLPIHMLNVNDSTGIFELDVDIALTSKNIDAEIMAIVGPGIETEIRYTENTARLQGACSGQSGDCDPVIG